MSSGSRQFRSLLTLTPLATLVDTWCELQIAQLPPAPGSSTAHASGTLTRRRDSAASAGHVVALRRSSTRGRPRARPARDPARARAADRVPRYQPDAGPRPACRGSATRRHQDDVSDAKGSLEVGEGFIEPQAVGQ